MIGTANIPSEVQAQDIRVQLCLPVTDSVIPQHPAEMIQSGGNHHTEMQISRRAGVCKCHKHMVTPAHLAPNDISIWRDEHSSVPIVHLRLRLTSQSGVE